MIADTGYDLDALAATIAGRGAAVVIKPNAGRNEPPAIDWHRYRERNVGERFWTGLAWYYQVGGLVARLLPPEVSGRGRMRWLEGPARDLARNVSLLQKALRFREEYPDKRDVRRLERIGAGWTPLYLTFAVADRGERRRLLREVVEQKWTPAQLRFEAQRRHPTQRRGVGGRRRKPVAPLGPEGALREMGRHTQTWLDFHAGAWAGVSDWRQLV